MEQRQNACNGSDTEKSLIEIFMGFGARMGHPFYRAIFYGDGRIEVEYQAPNPVESLVLKLGSLEAAFDLSKRNSGNGKNLDCVVIRKKCTKCFLHEREATVAG